MSSSLRTTRVALAAIAALAALPAPLLADATRASGPGFSLPIVAGYHLVDKPVPGATVVLVQSTPKPGWFRASIIVTPVNAALKRSEAEDAKGCADTGAAMSKNSGAMLKRVGIVDGPAGKTCQWEIVGAKQAAIGMLLWSARASWVVTCNRDPRDADATPCATALAGWRFDAP